ncbi:acetyl-CoA carboxylase biotin carboxyl carrier protein (plasmid) [Anaerobacillus sp. CMMVII]|uniref:acetyl-CoA carboxylase biotin carboxyl carrier protein n=1 Tax=Anaerobacillus sp. CMMVII TaxID=2755588 RepID=UPI0021B84593|nr:acetyl-CoA carboxylase biotin carboxyl carrier protein [Anaerobacillus sp. CMMVII]MCT8139224.1 acetyl-CoA carboxylase biotin carboxyl carrier protein [Anaerobacillus sp. CMMVII]
MFKINDLRELIRAVDRSNIDELIVKGENNEKVVIRKKGASIVVTENVNSVPPAVQSSQSVVPPPVPAAYPQEIKAEEPTTPVVVEEKLHKITSPMVGTFYAAPSPDAPAFVKSGDLVKNDTVVCIVEAMKLMNELEAEVNGEIVEVLVENGQLVEYGQPLFLVRV